MAGLALADRPCGAASVVLRTDSGEALDLDLGRWHDPATAEERQLLGAVKGPVIDLGCGPGRLVVGLAAQRVPALGVDSSPSAVALARLRGATVLQRDLFGPLPGEGRWATALLFDGNVGIGGDPRALLTRLTQLLVPGGLLIAETVPADVDERVHVHLTDAHGTQDALGTPFPWARTGTRALLRYATRTEWTAADQWTAGGRSFVALRNRGSSRSAEPAKSTAVISSQRTAKPSADSPVAVRYRRPV